MSKKEMPVEGGKKRRKRRTKAEIEQSKKEEQMLLKTPKRQAKAKKIKIEDSNLELKPRKTRAKRSKTVEKPKAVEKLAKTRAKKTKAPVRSNAKPREERVVHQKLKNVINGIKYQYNMNTQREICKKLGTSNSYLSDLINGKYPLVRYFCERLAVNFGVNPEYLLGDSEHMFLSELQNTTPVVLPNKRGRKSAKAKTQEEGTTEFSDPAYFNEQITKAFLDEIEKQRVLLENAQKQIDLLLQLLGDTYTKKS